MLTKFKSALQHCKKLTIIVTGDDDTITLVLIPDRKTDVSVHIQPITIKGSYEDVEAELPKAIEMVFEKNDVLISNANLVANAAAKSATNTSGSKTSKTVTKPTPAVVKPAEPVVKTADMFAESTQEVTPPEEIVVEEVDNDDDDAQHIQELEEERIKNEKESEESVEKEEEELF